MRRDQAPSYSTAAAHKALQRTLNLLSERRFSRHLFPAAQRCIPPDGSSENREPGPAEWDPKDRTLWRHTDSRTRRSQRAGIRRAGQKAPAVTRRCRCLTDERAGRRKTPGPARTAGNSEKESPPQAQRLKAQDPEAAAAAAVTGHWLQRREARGPAAVMSGGSELSWVTVKRTRRERRIF